MGINFESIRNPTGIAQAPIFFGTKKEDGLLSGGQLRCPDPKAGSLASELHFESIRKPPRLAQVPIFFGTKKI
jgi:hypothetical protein